MILMLICAIMLAGTPRAFPVQEPDTSTTRKKGGTGTIAGTVSAGGQRVYRAVVMASGGGRPTRSAVTDRNGKYVIKLVPVASYFVTVFHPQMAVSPDELGRYKQIVVRESEESRVDFELLRGGVITGYAVDQAGQPVVEQSVVLGIKGSSQPLQISASPIALTDDRGRFRLYGVPPGRYWIAVEDTYGTDPFGMTYYPGVPGESQALEATIVQGEEIDLGLLILRRNQVFLVEGRFVSDTSEYRVDDLEFTVAGKPRSGDHLQFPWKTGRDGEFVVSKLPAGEYKISPTVRSDSPSLITFEPVAFTIDGQDVTGLEIHPKPATSLKGHVEVEGGGRATNEDCMLILKEGVDLNFKGQAVHQIKLDADSSFSLLGLDRTRYTLLVISRNPQLTYGGASVDGEPVSGRTIVIDLSRGPRSVEIVLKHSE